jgi:thioredoxin reductase (NADPH)
MARFPVPDRVLILGAGPAGYTAAVYAARAGLRPRLIAGLQPGGQLTTTTEVENWPSEIAIDGTALVEKMRVQAEHYGATVAHDIAVGMDLSRRPFTVRGDSGAVWRAETLIVATGAQARWLGLPSEQALRGAGVSACATCDGFFFRGRDVVVVGGGNTAVEEALYLSHLARSVTLVHRRDQLRAERILQDRLFAQPKAQVIWDSVIDEVLAEGSPARVSGVRLRHVQTGAVHDLSLPRQIPPAPASPACSRQGMCEIGISARQSPRPVWAAWRPWMRTVFCWTRHHPSSARQKRHSSEPIGRPPPRTRRSAPCRPPPKFRPCHARA